MRQRVGRRDFLFARARPALVGSTETAEAGSSEDLHADSIPRLRSRTEIRRRAIAELDEGRLPLVARVERQRCLGSIGQVCTVCLERCPEPGVIRLVGTEPVIDADACTGCGECERRCPAPFPAIRLLPKEGGSR